MLALPSGFKIWMTRKLLIQCWDYRKRKMKYSCRKDCLFSYQCHRSGFPDSLYIVLHCHFPSLFHIPFARNQKTTQKGWHRNRWEGSIRILVYRIYSIYEQLLDKRHTAIAKIFCYQLSEQTLLASSLKQRILQPWDIKDWFPPLCRYIMANVTRKRSLAKEFAVCLLPSTLRALIVLT